MTPDSEVVNPDQDFEWILDVEIAGMVDALDTQPKVPRTVVSSWH